MKLISFVFPVYNEELGLDKLYEEMSKIMAQIQDKYESEIVFVNDGSKDGTIEKLVSMQEKDDRLNVINFSRNFRQQMAITAGLDYASGDAVIVMDADLQDPPQVALELIQKWEEGYEVVYAQRRKRKDPIIKRTISYFYYRILDKLTEIKIPKDVGEFRLLDRKVVDYVNQFREKNRFFRGIYTYVGFKQTAVLYDKNERYAGTAKFKFSHSLKLALDGIMGFSTAPLKMITQFGFFVTLLSFIGIVYEIILKLFFPPSVAPTGTTFIVISVLFIGGVQMMMLGVLGSYIGRIYTEVQNRPLYIVSSVYSKKDFHGKNKTTSETSL
ncbi:MAG: glycosyltransferase family 2 protein [bacterium]